MALRGLPGGVGAGQRLPDGEVELQSPPELPRFCQLPCRTPPPGCPGGPGCAGGPNRGPRTVSGRPVGEPLPGPGRGTRRQCGLHREGASDGGDPAEPAHLKVASGASGPGIGGAGGRYPEHLRCRARGDFGAPAPQVQGLSAREGAAPRAASRGRQPKLAGQRRGLLRGADSQVHHPGPFS